MDVEISYPSFSASDASRRWKGTKIFEGEYVAKSSRYPSVISLLGIDRRNGFCADGGPDLLLAARVPVIHHNTITTCVTHNYHC